MTDLTHRAERAVLGAMLTGPANSGTGLGVSDFTDSRHQAIYAMLTGPYREPSGLFARLRDWLARLSVRQQASQTLAYMDGLTAACPDPAHLPSYAAMVTEARQQRQQAPVAPAVVSQASQLDLAADWVAERTTGFPVPAGPTATATQASGAPEIPPGTALLARALQARTSHRPPAARAGVSYPPGPDVSAARAENVSGAQPAAVPAGPADDGNHLPGEAAARPQAQQVPSDPMLRVEDVQELVLADLMHRPHDANQLTGTLPAEMFTPGPARQLYELIRDRIGDDLPVDPLIAAWAVAQDPPGPGALTADYVLHVGSLNPRPGTAATLGRALLADHLCTRQLGKDWPELARPALAGIGVPQASAPAAPAATASPAKDQEPTGPAPSAGPAPGRTQQRAAAAGKRPRTAANAPVPASASPRAGQPPHPAGPAPVPQP